MSITKSANCFPMFYHQEKDWLNTYISLQKFGSNIVLTLIINYYSKNISKNIPLTQHYTTLIPFNDIDAEKVITCIHTIENTKDLKGKKNFLFLLKT